MSLETQAKAKEMMQNDPIEAWQLLHDLAISAQEHITAEFAGDREMDKAVAAFTAACNEVKRVSRLTVAQYVCLRHLEQKPPDERSPEQVLADRERLLSLGDTCSPSAST